MTGSTGAQARPPGGRYWLRGDASLAEAFYRKTLAILAQDAWPVLHKLETDSRHNGR